MGFSKKSDNGGRGNLTKEKGISLGNWVAGQWVGGTKVFWNSKTEPKRSEEWEALGNIQ